MKTNLRAKYYLNDDQINKLVDVGMTNKVNWWLKNNTTNQFINYDKVLGIERIKGNAPFDVTFPEGTFEAGTELVAGVGDYNTKDERGYGCSQKAYFYITDVGEAVQCKYNELPSKNGGKLPPMPESEQSETTVPTQQANKESIPVVSSDCGHECNCEYLCVSSHVFCDKYEDIYRALDSCTEFDNCDPNNGDEVCMYCTHHTDVYKKKA